MKLITDEKILMEGDYKQIILTTHRIRQENTGWGKVDLVSIMLEHVSSCKYSKKSKPIFLIIGILLAVFGFAIGNSGGNAQQIGAGIFLFGVVLIIIFFFTIKRGLFISSSSAKVIVNTKGMKTENIKAFIDKLEIAKNDRLAMIQNKPE